MMGFNTFIMEARTGRSLTVHAQCKANEASKVGK